MYGYIYKTENMITHDIYIGKKALPNFRKTYHGAGKRIKKDIEKYGKENFSTEMICEAENSEELNALEIENIEKYKLQYGDQCINSAKGGDGGNTLQYASDEKKDKFRKTMTEINQKRCRSEEFRQKTGERMKKKYEDPEERKKHSDKIKQSWSNTSLREEQSKRLKEYYKDHPKDCSFNNKRCTMELNGEVMEFDSRKELKKFLKDEYGVTFANPAIKEMLESGKPYRPFHKNKSGLSKLSGMILHNSNEV